jgi:hypothetical protein
MGLTHTHQKNDAAPSWAYGAAPTGEGYEDTQLFIAV